MADSPYGYSDFLSTNPAPDYMDFLNRGLKNRQNKLAGGTPKLGTLSANAAGQGLGNIDWFGASGIPLGYAGLNEILSRQGRQDPAMLNMQLGDISRTTQGNQMQTQEGLTQAGLQGSGMGQAIMAAIGQGGANQRQNLLAKESMDKEQRQRQDIELMMRAYMDPAMQAYATGSGVSMQNSANKQNNDAAKMAGYASLIAAIACWVAREVYGSLDPRWLTVRKYVLAHDIRDEYLAVGPMTARFLRRYPKFKAIFKRPMDLIVAAG